MLEYAVYVVNYDVDVLQYEVYGNIMCMLWHLRYVC